MIRLHLQHVVPRLVRGIQGTKPPIPGYRAFARYDGVEIKSQQGYLSLITVLLIVVVGFLGIAITYMFVGSATSSVNFILSDKALYVAEGGLEKGTRYLLAPSLSGASSRIACSAVSGNANLTNSSLGDGTFTVTRVSGSPFYASSTLSGNISSSATTISVASTASFASSGRILIDGEAMNYSAISGNSFVGVTRGANFTVASSHSSGAYISQYQCSLDSLGGIPNLTSSLSKRELQQGVQLQEGWVVGVRNGNDFTFSHWNRPTELQWANASITDSVNREDLNVISLLSNAEGWAVGVIRSSQFTFLHLMGSSWTATPVSGACSGQHLNGVSAVSSTEAWAVGERYRVTGCNSGNFRYTILKWSGSSWNLLSSSTSPSIPADGASGAIDNLNAVHVIATTSAGTGNIGFAVGDNGKILKFNGSQWTTETSPVTNDLFGVFTVSTSEAWAVGNSGRLLKWNGSSWSSITSGTSQALNAIAMFDSNADGLADFGIAAGNSGLILTYNGSSWSSQDLGGTNYFAAAVSNENDAWVAGVGGAIMHWDGSSWTSVASNVSTRLNGIAVVPQKQFPFSGWQEIFP